MVPPGVQGRRAQNSASDSFLGYRPDSKPSKASGKPSGLTPLPAIAWEIIGIGQNRLNLYLLALRSRGGVSLGPYEVNEELDVHITGSGGLKYRGEPRISESISGAGRISRVD